MNGMSRTSYKNDLCFGLYRCFTISHECIWHFHAKVPLLMMSEKIRCRWNVDGLVTRWTKYWTRCMGFFVVFFALETSSKCRWTSYCWTLSRGWESPVSGVSTSFQCNPTIVFFILVLILARIFIICRLLRLYLLRINQNNCRAVQKQNAVRITYARCLLIFIGCIALEWIQRMDCFEMGSQLFDAWRIDRLSTKRA